MAEEARKTSLAARVPVGLRNEARGIGLLIVAQAERCRVLGRAADPASEIKAEETRSTP